MYTITYGKLSSPSSSSPKIALEEDQVSIHI